MTSSRSETAPSETALFTSCDVQLAAVLSHFARTLLTDFPIQGVLDRLLERTVAILSMDAAGVTLLRPGALPHHIAVSGCAAIRYENLHTGIDDGPRLQTYQSGAAVAVPDLNCDDRFPIFVSRARLAGLGAVFTFPLRHGDHQLGTLDLYRAAPGALSPHAMEAAQTLADVAAAYVLNAQTRLEFPDVPKVSVHTALHDPLTGLPNRVVIVQRLREALFRNGRSGNATAVFFLDLDHFGAVNDAHGHRLGDQLLVAVAKRLGELLRPRDTLGRLSGDEFVVVCQDLDARGRAEAIGERLATAFTRPFRVFGEEIRLTASIGIAVSERGGRSPEEMLRDADKAMYRAKRRGGGQQHLFRTKQDERSTPDVHSTAETGLEIDLAAALKRKELYTVYQPIVASLDGRIVGFEALLRWAHPTRGLVPPSVFIPLAEQSGLIIDLGRWVLGQAWTDLRRWRMQLPAADLKMSVNLSARQLLAPGLAESVAALMESADAEPASLILEVTESILISDSQRALRVLKGLKNLGVQLALDDFGTGYSSLIHLSQFPVDVVKIDQAFVAHIGRDSTSQIIVGAVVQLAHGLGMTVIAEGIETELQHVETTALRCDLAQGFYFAPPLPAADIDTIVRDHIGGGGDLHLPRARQYSAPNGAGKMVVAS